MSKRKNPTAVAKSPTPKPAAAEPPAGETDPFVRLLPSATAVRETIESVMIAVVLALLFRTFEAEAFVIPTGSMAPTLMGRHEDVYCPQCGFRFQVGDSDNAQKPSTTDGICPNCHYRVDVSDKRKYPAFSGDRILVSKFAYDLAEPQRWDVAVFHFPGDAKTNYIKRLVGLPEETVAVYGGSLYVKGPHDEAFSIARKPPRKLLATLQPVFDGDHWPAELLREHWPLQWQPGEAVAQVVDDRDPLREIQAEPEWNPQPTPEVSGAWKAVQSPTDLHLSTNGKAADMRWIRYCQMLRTPEDHTAGWLPLTPPARGMQPDFFQPFPGRIDKPHLALVQDFCPYNTYSPLYYGKNSWVGNLALACTLNVGKILDPQRGEVILELVRAGRRYRCHVQAATGKVQLEIVGRNDFAPAAQTTLATPGAHQVLFTNIDQELRLWVDGQLVEFQGPTNYDTPVSMQPFQTAVSIQLQKETLRNELREKLWEQHVRREEGGHGDGVGLLREEVRQRIADLDEQQRPFAPPRPRQADLSPAAIGAQGVALDVEHVKIFRSVYYYAVDIKPEIESAGPVTLYDQYALISAYPLAKDQFLMMGDNSPCSKDSRLWPIDPEYPGGPPLEYFVRRDLLIGKALFVYWPHSWDEVQLGPVHIPFPFFPNVEKMRPVR